MNFFKSVCQEVAAFFGKAYKAVADVTCRVIAAVTDAVTGAVKTVAAKVETTAAEYGVSTSILGFTTATVALALGTVALVTVGLPAVIVPLTGIAVVIWLARDSGEFLVCGPTNEERAEALTRVWTCIFVGTLTAAALTTCPTLAGCIIGPIVVGLMYREFCSRNGASEIVARVEALTAA